MPRTSAKSQERSSEEAIAFALSHRVRVEILSELNVDEFSASELSRRLGHPQSTVQYHLQELLEAGAIEVSRTVPARNFEQRFYRATTSAEFDVPDLSSWSVEKRQQLYGLIIQNAGAEALTALHAGTISNEPSSWLTWARYNVDRQGWAAMGAVFERVYREFQEIEAESLARAEAGGEEPRTFICSLQGYPRSRKARSSYPHPPAT